MLDIHFMHISAKQIHNIFVFDIDLNKIEVLHYYIYPRFRQYQYNDTLCSKT